jgi:acid phosphatase (class A)
LAAAAVLLASLQAATASGQALNGDPLTDRGYLRPDEIDASALLGPPPAPGSPRGIADWARFIETRSLEGSERWRIASLDVDVRSGAFARFSCAAGVTIDQQRTPATWKVLARLEYDVRTVGRPAKDRYGRLRPITGNTYSICEPRAAWLTLNASYPSGHSMIGWSYALTLAQLLPDRSEVLIENGKAYGESRIICGVHYQSDVEAGRLLRTTARNCGHLGKRCIGFAGCNRSIAASGLDKAGRHALFVFKQRLQKMFGRNALVIHADRNSLGRLQESLGPVGVFFEVHSGGSLLWDGM